MDDKDGRVSQRAYAIWQEQGEPEGREAQHWRQAERELADTDDRPVDDALTETLAEATPAKSKKKPARASKPA